MTDNEMKEYINAWGIPKIKELKDRELAFMFDTNDLKISHKFCEDLHCTKNSVICCLYDMKRNEIILVLNFLILIGGLYPGDTREIHLKLDTIVVIDPMLRKKGLAAYYLNKIREYAESRNIKLIKLHADSQNKAFKILDKENSLSNEELKPFYLKHLKTDTIHVEFV